MRRPVLLTAPNMHKFNVREWGVPSLCMPGKAWRSERHQTISCLLALPRNPGNLRVETRKLLIVDHAADQWIPATWIRAARVYASAWPDSAPRLRGVPWRPKPKPRPTKP